MQNGRRGWQFPVRNTPKSVTTLPLLPLSFIPIWVKYAVTKMLFSPDGATQSGKSGDFSQSPCATRAAGGTCKAAKAAFSAAHVPHDPQGSCKNLLYDLSYLDDYAENVQIHKKKQRNS